MRIIRRSAAAFSIAAALALVPTAPASAVEYDQVAFTTTTSTLEYGQSWSFPVEAGYFFYSSGYQSGKVAVVSTGTPSGYTPSLSLYEAGGQTATGYLTAPYDVAPLSPGSYTFTITGDFTDAASVQYNVQTTPPAQLTITKAKLGVELRVLADTTNGTGAIVTAKFTGRFVDEYSSSFFVGAAQSPAGTWKISIKKADGTVATERNVERAAGDDVLATSFYWADAEPGEQYTASATFVASGVSANNFSIAAAQDFAYTAPQSARPVPTSSATSKPDTSLPEATGFGLPLWVLILVGAFIVGLGVLVTILSVRVHRRSSPRAGEVQS